jgi:hypothetical protein
LNVIEVNQYPIRVTEHQFILKILKRSRNKEKKRIGSNETLEDAAQQTAEDDVDTRTGKSIL